MTLSDSSEWAAATSRVTKGQEVDVFLPPSDPVSGLSLSNVTDSPEILQGSLLCLLETTRVVNGRAETRYLAIGRGWAAVLEPAPVGQVALAFSGCIAVDAECPSPVPRGVTGSASPLP